MRVIGPFEIGEVLARGGSSAVHAARWYDEPELDLVAKVARSGSELRLHQENATLREVEHPRVIRPVGFVDDMATVALVLPRAVCSLRAHAKRLEPAAVASVAADIAGALAALHRVGYAHGDVTGGNILLDREGAALLADFGHARHCTPEAARADVVGLAEACLEASSPDGQPGLTNLLRRVSANPISPHQLLDQLSATVPDVRRPDPLAVPAIVDEPPTMATS